MASGIGIGVNNNILIDTDNNASTGLKNYLWQNMGCDYMLENGNIYKYTGDGTSWSWILQSSTYLESKNSNVYEACVNIGDINVSSPVRIKAGYYTSDSGNTKIGYAPALGSQIAIVDMSPITVNGGYDDWAGYKPIAPGDNEINNLSAVQKDNNLYLLVKSAAYGINVNNGFLIDTDNNSATGCRFGAWADCGADYLIENSSVYRYAGDGSSFVWQKIGTVSPLRNEWNSVYEVAVPLSMLGLDGPTTIKIGYYTSDSSFKQTGFAPVYQTQMAVCNP